MPDNAAQWRNQLIDKLKALYGDKVVLVQGSPLDLCKVLDRSRLIQEAHERAAKSSVRLH